MGQSAALYCRVSIADQTCARQERDLRAFVKKAGYKVVGIWKETASGAKQERAERKKVLALAQARKVDVILVHRTDPLALCGLRTTVRAPPKGSSTRIW